MPPIGPLTDARSSRGHHFLKFAKQKAVQMGGLEWAARRAMPLRRALERAADADGAGDVRGLADAGEVHGDVQEGVG